MKTLGKGYYCYCNYSNPQIMKHLQSVKFISIIFIILINTTSCSKDDLGRDEHKAAITVNLKSSFSEHENVFLDIADMQVKIKEDGNSPNAWVSLNTINSGTHNVSDLRGESELLLVDHFEINPTYIYEIRLVLGDNNFMNIGETLMSLDVDENASASNLVQRNFEGNHIYQILIDINVDESISFNEDENTMVLNPKLYTEIRKF